MDEVNRFSFNVDHYGCFTFPHTIQYVITQNSDGLYHIHHKTVYPDGSEADSYTTDIHGAMDKDAYINWLTNALFNASHKQATPEQKIWLQSYQPEIVEDSS